MHHTCKLLACLESNGNNMFSVLSKNMKIWKKLRVSQSKLVLENHSIFEQTLSTVIEIASSSNKMGTACKKTADMPNYLPLFHSL